MLFAVTQLTAAEIVVQRADPGRPNMALTAWKSGRVRKDDVVIAKNYLRAEEIDQLNRIVTMFLDFAELRAQQRSNIRMADWRQNVDSFIQFNERPLLQNAGRVSHEQMVQIAHERYAEFDAKRRSTEAIEADKQDINALEEVDRLSKSQTPRKPR